MDEFMYANKFAIAVGPVDTHFTFTWSVPIYDETTGNINGEEQLKSVSLTMSNENFSHFARMITDTVDQINKSNDEDALNDSSNS